MKQNWIDDNAGLRDISFTPEVCIGKDYICAPLQGLTAQWLVAYSLIFGQKSMSEPFDTPFNMLCT